MPMYLRCINFCVWRTVIKYCCGEDPCVSWVRKQNCNALFSQLDLQSWEDLSRNILERARAEIARGAEVIHRLHLGVHQAANKMGAKSDRVGDALRLRVHDTERAIRELEFQRSMVSSTNVTLNR
ncbi:hypothetical protein AHF37_12623 [Paragonimus kellicotti]|nr:hypothetical protein AHF37_12623 [Paragonimus kellicotti]